MWFIIRCIFNNRSFSIDESERNVIIESVLREKIDHLFQDNGKPIYPSDHIWREVSYILLDKHDISLKPKSIYNNVLKNIYYLNTTEPEISADQFYNDSSDTDESKEELAFTITFTKEEWQDIQPSFILYGKSSNAQKKHIVLQPHKWSSLFFTHFFGHTRLPCCLNFKRASVKTSSEVFVEVFGKCSECESVFRAVLCDEPKDNPERILFKATYNGNFYSLHKDNKKRQLSSSSRRKVAEHLLTTNEQAGIY